MQQRQQTAQNVYSFLQSNAIPIQSSPYGSHNKKFQLSNTTNQFQTFQKTLPAGNFQQFEKGYQSQRANQSPINIGYQLKPKQELKIYEEKNLLPNNQLLKNEISINQSPQKISKGESEANQIKQIQKISTSSTLLDIIEFKNTGIHNEIKEMLKFQDISELVSLLSKQIDNVIQGLSLKNSKDQEEIVGRTKLKLKLIFEVVEKALSALEDHLIEYEKMGISTQQEQNEFLISDFHVPWESKQQESSANVNIQTRFQNNIPDSSPVSFDFFKGIQSSQNFGKDDFQKFKYELQRENINQQKQQKQQNGLLKIGEISIKQSSSSSDTMLV